MPALQALIYLKGVCSALAYAHHNGVVHCDIKPGNVMIDRGGNIYLTDFGIARHAESTTTTMAGAGSPGYMAPEQIRGLPVTPQTDVYALGVMLYEMLTGRRPFTGSESGTDSASNATAAERVRYAHLSLPPPDPRSLDPAIPDELADLVLCALKKDPLGRYQSALQMFETACAVMGVQPQQVPDRVDPPKDTRTQRIDVPSGVTGSQKRSRLPAWAIVAGIGGMLAVCALGFGFLVGGGLPAAWQPAAVPFLNAETQPPSTTDPSHQLPTVLEATPAVAVTEPPAWTIPPSQTALPTHTDYPTPTPQPTYTQPPTVTPTITLSPTPAELFIQLQNTKWQHADIWLNGAKVSPRCQGGTTCKYKIKNLGAISVKYCLIPEVEGAPRICNTFTATVNSSGDLVKIQ
jgi:serine/threonine-protein kinase